MKKPTLKQRIIRWSKAHLFKTVAIIFWVLILVIYFWYKNKYNLTNIEVAKVMYYFVVDNYWGPLIYIVFYSIRAIILFPPSIMTLISGILFGPFRGIVYTLIGENFSANLAYLIGRKLSKGWIDPSSQSIIGKVKKKITSDEFLSLILIRFVPIPFDLVNYTCGILKIKWKKFAGATALAIIPGMITFVLFGASIENIETFSAEKIGINSSFFLLAVIFYSVTLLIAYLVRKYTKYRRIPKIEKGK